MVKNKKIKGFTLIELLAVIVILAIIALIATPLILNVISDAKKGSFQASSYGIIEASEQAYARSLLKGDNVGTTAYEYKEGKEEILQGDIKINYKGSKPYSGTLIINNEGKVAIAFHQDGFCATKSYSESKITIDKKSVEDCIIPEDIPNVVSQFDETKGINKPILTEGMTPIKWDEENNEIETTKDDPDWYDYSNKKWANAKTDDGSYWVWIPRYAYKMLSGYHSSTAGEFDIVFLKEETNENDKGITIETSGYEARVKDTSMHYFLHPAFNQGEEEILGYWVAKFEPSGTVSNISVKPNISSLREITIGDMYDSAYAMRGDSKFGWNASTTDTHMMTNYEWGAVAYLTHSQYGKNGEVWINPNNGYTTGCAGTGPSVASTTECNAYNTANGMQASTTGNITGIYDMSGGSYEYVAAYLNNGHASLTTNGNIIITASSKYKNVYIKASTDDRQNNYNQNKNIYGDAVWETSSAGEGSTSWNGDYSAMLYTSSPFFRRGGYPSSATFAGMFSFIYNSGASSVAVSFRPVARLLG